MSQKILLSTTDDIANAFKTSVTENTNQLEFIKHNVPVFHNLIQVLKHTHPDIVYIMFNQVRFDSNNKQEINNQILQTIYNIKADADLCRLRIAVQVTSTTDQYFLRQLIMLNVYDIFEPSGNTGQLNIRKVIEQLVNPINIGNVKKYLLSPDINQNFQSPDVLPVRDTFSSPNGGNPTPTKTAPVADDTALINENRFLKGELARLNNKLAVPSVPRTDYDDLLARLRELINNGPGDATEKEAVESVISNNYSLSEDNEALNDRLKESTKLIGQLESKISTLKSQSAEFSHSINKGHAQETSMPRTGNENVSQDVTQPSRRKSVKSQPRVAKPKPRRSMSRDNDSAAKTHDTRKRKWLIPIIAFIIILLAWTGLGHLKTNSKKTVKQQPSYSQLIKQEKYAQAAQAYPDKGVAIENKMLSDSNVKNKASQAKKIAVFASGDAIDFDNYYFNGQFKKAVKLYEDSNETSLTHLTDARRTMLAYSYMKIGKVDEARKLAQPLNNDQLNQKIEAYAKFQDANKTLQDKIDNGNLSDEDKANAQKQIEENKAAMKNL